MRVEIDVVRRASEFLTHLDDSFAQLSIWDGNKYSTFLLLSFFLQNATRDQETGFEIIYGIMENILTMKVSAAHVEGLRPICHADERNKHTLPNPGQYMPGPDGVRRDELEHKR